MTLNELIELLTEIRAEDAALADKAVWMTTELGDVVQIDAVTVDACGDVVVAGSL